MYKSGLRLRLKLFQILLLTAEFSIIESAIFGEVSQLYIWITSSSLVNKQSDKSLIFRQIEINWINAPLYHEGDYIALYLDSQPRDGSLPVSIHLLNGQTSGQIITDYHLPSIDFYNETVEESNRKTQHQLLDGFNHLEFQSNEETNDKRSPRLLRQSEIRKRFLKEECFGYCIAYHSGKRILAENCLKTNPTWMQDSHRYLKSKSLPALMLPGTHNSATYPKRLDESVLHMINKYQQNQDCNIFNQLVFGIRYLDLRVGYSKVKHSPDRFWIYHDIFRTEVSVREVLEQVRRFLELTSHEIIIMDFHRFTVGFHNENSKTAKERHAILIDMILNELEHFIVPSYLGYHAPLDEYTSMGRRLLVGYAERDLVLNSRLELGAKLIRQEEEEEEEQEDNKQQVEDVGLANEQNPEIQNETAASIASLADTTTKPILADRLSTDIEISNTTNEHSAKIISSSSMEDYMYPAFVVNNRSPQEDNSALSKATLFFHQIRHLWPNKDTLADLTRYLNETACRVHFGELKSLMVELTPTVFGVISDKYNGNRKLAELVNRPVTDMIRDRWLHCVNIVASDYFLGNDLIRLSIHANKMRSTHQDFDFSSNGYCRSFRRIQHLLDRSKIAPQFIQLPASTSDISQYDNHYYERRISLPEKDTITHWRIDGSPVSLKILTSADTLLVHERDRKESFLDSVSEGFTSLFATFKKLLNL